MKKYNLKERMRAQIFAFLILNILLAACTANLKPAISIQPAEALFDQPVSIRLSGFKPNQEVTVRVSATVQTNYVLEYLEMMK